MNYAYEIKFDEIEKVILQPPVTEEFLNECKKVSRKYSGKTVSGCDKQKLLSGIVNELSSTAPQMVAEVKCSDGIRRNRPLIDIATAVEIVNSFRGKEFE